MSRAMQGEFNMRSGLRRHRMLPGIVSAALVVTATPIIVTAPSAHADTDDPTYQTQVEFQDGSSVITDLATQSVTTTPGSNGSPGAAAAAVAGGGVDTDGLTPAPTNAPGEEGQATANGTGGLAPDPGADDPGVGPGGGGVDPGPGGVTADSPTPGGFRLWGTNTTAYGYTYTSDYLKTYLNKCQGSCTHIGRVDVRFKQYLYGGSSITWKLTPNTYYQYGPAYSSKYYYWCGVNVPNATDPTCATADDTADYSGTGPYSLTTGTTGNRSYSIYKYFGHGYHTRAKFPMIEMITKWPGYSPTVTEKFRGWDIRDYSGTWKMSPASGTGF
jgi:hypothetical protein